MYGRSSNPLAITTIVMKSNVRCLALWTRGVERLTNVCRPGMRFNTASKWLCIVAFCLV